MLTSHMKVICKLEAAVRIGRFPSDMSIIIAERASRQRGDHEASELTYAPPPIQARDRLSCETGLRQVPFHDHVKSRGYLVVEFVSASPLVSGTVGRRHYI